MLDRLRPLSVLHLHLAAETITDTNGDAPRVVRTEQLGPISLTQLQEILGTHRITVAPVLDPLGVTPVDSYEIPTRLRRATPACTRSKRTARSNQAAGDPTRHQPGRRRAWCREHSNVADAQPAAAALHAGDVRSRRQERSRPGPAATEGPPQPPTGHWYRVDHTGTTPLGTTTPEVLRPTKTSPMDTTFTDLILNLAA